MSKIRQIAILGSARGLNTLVNFLFLPYLARALSYEDYGSYGQAILIVTFLSAFLTFGLPQIVYVYFNSRNIKDVISSSLMASSLLSLIGLSFAIFFRGHLAFYFDNEALSDLIFIYAFSLLLSLPNQVLNSYLVFNQLIKKSATIAIFTNLIKILLVLLAIQLYSSVYLALAGIVVSQCIQFILCLKFAWKDLKSRIDFSLLKDLVRDGLPIGLTGLLGSGILYADGLMVSKMLGTESYAIYRNGALEVPFISTLYTSVAAIVLPEVARLFNKDQFDTIMHLKKKVIMNTIYLTYPILVFLLFYATEIVVIYLGEKYEASAIVFSVFNLTLLIRINDYSDILIAAKKTRYIFTFYLLTFIFNLLFNYMFIKLFGSVGAAMATVLSLALLAFLQLNMSMRLIKKKLINLFDWKNLTHLLIICVGIGFFLNAITSLITNNPIISIAIGAFYFPLVFGYLYKKNFYSKQITEALLKKNRFLKRWV